ncbi:hybrid non-ribosomal peptide synthetase/type I polyketide synthase [Brevibacillus laterosporus]|uniref:Phenolphthiocerol/phthiocerol polyketide synthase subunit E n=1 Tax=Brevibacillus laterosporus TaxID=1465 RepID=A0A0F7EJ98_BRELA|nr:hybrid non-ribosomal peptide synthetase/type I polyketide synthase [Brevibacillus laterosporus]AKF95949.1 hypothetical protein EX87_20440 [Brevibacillus laterosporus]
METDRNHIDRKNLEDILSLTPTQEGMLFHYLEAPSSEDYFEQLSLRLMGNIQIDHFESAWQYVVENNEMLRTVFRWQNVSQPIQIVLKQYKPEIKFVDLSDLSDESQQEALETVKSKNKADKFDLHRVPFRIILCKLGEEIHEMIITNHHIIYDGWSNGILLKEFLIAYNELYNDGYLSKVSKVKFKEYVKKLQLADKSKQETFWKSYLSGFDTLTEIPFDQQPGISDFLKENMHVSFSQERLKGFAMKHGFTLASFLFTVWGILLQKYNNRKDVIFGTPVAGRNVDLAGIQNMVGNFINTVPLRVQASPTDKALDVVKKINKELHQREEYELTPLVEISQYSELDLKQGLFRSIVVMDDYPLDSILMKKDNTLFIEDYSLNESTSYDLTVSVKLETDVLINFNYNKNLLSNEMMVRMIGHFKTIMEEILDNPDICLADLNILTEVEKKEIMYVFNNNKVEIPNVTVHQLFEMHTRKFPDAIAVKYQDKYITYHELNQHANQLAHYLCEKELKKENLVAIHLERSPLMIASILAVWKAGGAYIPINTQDPADRICTILEDSQAALLFTKQEYVTEEVKKHFKGTIIYIDEEAKNVQAQSTDNLQLEASGCDLAYVIYTSGSTGKPKGAMVEHIGMLNHMIAKQKLLDVTESSIVAQNASHTFDISVWQFFVALISGGTTIIYPNELILDAEKFLTTLGNDNITILEVVPSYLSILLESVETAPHKLDKLEYLLVTGEDVKAQLVNKWFEFYPFTKIVNAYGPTEASDDITHYVMDKPIGNKKVAVGTAVQNLNVYIVDEDMNLCPIGIKGEICVSGIGVGRGYLNDYEKTSKAFLLDPFIKEENVRLYKTGDIGCFRKDGTVEYFGRMDYQVKIRGFRIELGEIENVLVSYPGIKEAVVLDHEDENSEKYLSAYLTAYKPIDQSKLRSYLASKLPDYMIPTHNIILDKLPLTSNGKVDKKQLLKSKALNNLVTFVSMEELTEQLEEKLSVRPTFTAEIEEGKGTNQTGQGFECFIMGESTLTISCAELLLERGHRIIGIATEDEQVADWAKANHLPTMKINNKEYEAFINGKIFDYLFSIYNVAILPKKIIELPKKAVINFHDSYLPKYAGMYVPSWAIINQEREHGVSWHLMDEGIDTGNILIQEKIRIDSDETAYSLHLKCYESAIRTFNQLMNNIESNQEFSYLQDKNERSYFGKYQRPANACLISFQWEAEKIQAFVNGLTLNTSVLENPLGLPKIQIGNDYYLIEDMTILPTPSTMEPGTIIEIHKEYLRIATASNDIHINRILSLEGEELTIPKQMEAQGIIVGAQISENVRTEIGIYNEKITRYEEYWVSKLERYEPLLINRTVLVCQENESVESSTFSQKRIELPAMMEKHSPFDNQFDQILAWLTMYLTGIIGNIPYDIEYSDTTLYEETEMMNKLFSSYVPIRIEIQPDAKINQVMKSISEELMQVRKHKTYIKDIYLRYPKLLLKEVKQNKFTLSITIADNIQETINRIITEDKKLSFILSKSEDAVTIVYDSLLVEEARIDTFINGFCRFIEQAMQNPELQFQQISQMGVENQLISICRSLVRWEDKWIHLTNLEESLMTDAKINHVYLKSQINALQETVICAFIESNERISGSYLTNLMSHITENERIPIEFIQLEKFPLSENGAIHEEVLNIIASSLIYGNDATPEDDIEQEVLQVWMDVLGKDKIGTKDNFFDIGGNSLLIIRMISKFKNIFDVEIPVTTLFKYPTIKSLAEYIKNTKNSNHENNEPIEVIEEVQTISSETENNDIAIIGLSCRFPGARNADEFWNNLINAEESISFFTEEELIENGVDYNLIKHPNYVKAKGVVEDIEYFDASFFGYSPKEAKFMDPQARFLHECTWEALEDAGYSSDDTEKNIGMYVGATNNFFWLSKIFDQIDESISQFETNLLNDRDFLATHVSYKLNLKGPSMTLQTACSTSLIAVDMAIQSILDGKCKMAIAGGVSITYPKKTGYIYQEGMVNSPDGHCRAFDEKASGTLQGTGIGLVVLKGLEDAIKDGDQIYAVIKGSAINNDGANKIGYTAPSVEGQTKVIRSAHQKAGISPETVSYVETHGTGTILGDPIEVEALTHAFQTDRRRYCAIGSVKTNIGHLDVAAGIAGLIKTTLSLHHKLIPPSLNFSVPNPKIDFEHSPFFVNSELRTWESDGPRRAGVSSFGIGGTNAHIVLEEAPALRETTKDKDRHMLMLSGKTATALDKATNNLLEYLKQNSTASLADISYSLQVGRKDFAYRRALVCSSTQEAIDILSQENSRKLNTNHVEQEDLPVIFMFSGLGSQYVQMGRELYESVPYFKSELDKCFDILRNIDEKTNYQALLFPEEATDDGTKIIHQIEIAQPIVFCFEYALAKLLINLGVKPTSMIGYSFGEYVAACISGVFSLEDVLSLIIYRGSLINELPRGHMLGVPIPKEKVLPLLGNQVSIAIDNGESCVISGPIGEVEKIEKQLLEKRILCMPVDTSHALHSEMMRPIITRFIEQVTSIKRNKPAIPYISNVTGTWVTDEQATNPEYWAKHITETVQFAKGIQTIIPTRPGIFVEIGPGSDLSQLLIRFLERDEHKVINLIRPEHRKISDESYFLSKISLLWLYGQKINWQSFYAEQTRRRLSLPTYPFEKEYYWFDQAVTKKEKQSKWFFGKNKNLNEWFYVPAWERSIPLNAVETADNDPKCWLAFINDHYTSKEIVTQLTKRGKRLVTIKVGECFQQKSETEYELNPANKQDFQRLFEKLKKLEFKPGGILHTWGITIESDVLEATTVQRTLTLGFYSLVYIAQSLGEQNMTNDLKMKVLTNNMNEVVGGDLLYPEKSTVLGTVKVIPLEYQHITCTSIDISLPERGSKEEGKLFQHLVKEILFNDTENIVSYRGSHRWLPSVKQIRLQKRHTSSRLREKGVYLITGGLGGMGLHMAEYLAKTVQAKLILVSRSDFPKKATWKDYEKLEHYNESIAKKIEKLREMEEYGAEITVISADISDKEQMSKVIKQTESMYGSINGVLHTAGVAEYDGVIQTKQKKNIEKVFASKIYGTLVLHHLLQGKALDFFGICSSLAPVIYHTKLGQVAYCSANEFIDSYVHYYNSFNDGVVFAINWADWQEVGMSVESAKHWGQKLKLENSDSILEDGILPHEGVEAFHTVLENDYPQVMVSPEDLIEKISSYKQIGISTLQAILEESNDYKSHYERPKLSTDYVEPRTEMEKMLCKIWSKIFGVEEIGINDDFLELGGDSLKALTAISQIHQVMGIRVSLPEFFKHPNIKEFSNFILERDEEEEASEEFSSIEPVVEREYYELSSAQKRMYILNQMEPDSTNYNMAFAWKIEGKLDKERLQKAFNEIIDRHESLRTSFEMIGNEPFQRIHPKLSFELESIKVDEQEVNQLIQNFNRPFCLDQAPLLRTRLLQIGKDRHILIMNIHHIVSDGVSNNVLISDLINTYNNKKLTPLRIQYKDYTEWEKKKQKTELFIKQQNYWIEQFQDELPRLNLPYDFNRPAKLSTEGEAIDIYVDEHTTKKLKGLALKEETTSYTLMLSVFNILLAKLSQQEDIIIGSPIVGRNHSDVQNVVGMFVNTLALRNFPKGEMSFRQFLKNVNERVIQSIENQDYQFNELVNKLDLERDVSRNPLFDVMFGYQTALETMHFEGLSCTPYEYKKKESQFDLSLDILETEGRMKLTLEYSTRLFTQAKIKKFAGYLQNIVTSMVDNIDVTIANIDMLTDEDKHLLLHDLNSTEAPYSTDKTIIDLLEEQAIKTPKQTAVYCEGETLTYEELHEKVNRWAVSLHAKGVDRNTLIPIMAEPSLEMIVGVLAILKAGGAYVPIDEDSPDQRILYILNDTKAKLLVTSKACKEKVQFLMNQDTSVFDIVYLDGEALDASDPDDYMKRSEPTDLMYVMYTSGTTGNPKGVMVGHKNVVNYVEWFRKEFSMQSEFNMLLLTKYTFDPSVGDIFGTLSTGGTLHVVNKYMLLSKSDLRAYITKHQINLINEAPTLVKEIIASDEKLPSIKYVIVGGERVPEFLKDQLLDLGYELYNHYGPTETTIDAVTSKCSKDTKISIGQPISNVRTYILDKYNCLVPPGVSGELCISGVGVSYGYLNNSELTAEKFVPNPYEAGQVMYKTGDLVRLNERHQIEFIGRMDNQVKVRGIRVELEELESILLRHPAIMQAVVLSKEDEVRGHYLIAYYSSDIKIDSFEIREYLAEHLPPAILPSHIVQIKEFQTNSNGKIDRHHLTNIVLRDDKETFSSENEVEVYLSEIWQKVLQCDEISVHDNFFHIGGTSLLILKMKTLLESRYPKVQVIDLFTYPTISKLAEFIIKSEEKEDLVQLNDVGVRLPDSYMVQGHEFVKNEITDYKIKVDYPIWRSVTKKAQELQIEREDIFLGLYVYLLSEVSNTESFHVQTLLGDKANVICSTPFDLHDIVSEDDLFKEIHNVRKATSIENSYQVSDLNVIQFDVGVDMIVPFVCKKGLYDSVNSFTAKFDFILEIKDYVDEADLFFTFNTKRLKQEKIESFIGFYASLLSNLGGHQE